VLEKGNAPMNSQKCYYYKKQEQTGQRKNKKPPLLPVCHS
jgi:hypothetical protein